MSGAMFGNLHSGRVSLAEYSVTAGLYESYGRCIIFDTQKFRISIVSVMP